MCQVKVGPHIPPPPGCASTPTVLDAADSVQPALFPWPLTSQGWAWHFSIPNCTSPFLQRDLVPLDDNPALQSISWSP